MQLTDLSISMRRFVYDWLHCVQKVKHFIRFPTSKMALRCGGKFNFSYFIFYKQDGLPIQFYDSTSSTSMDFLFNFMIVPLTYSCSAAL